MRVMYFELLPPSATIYTEVYCDQLDELKQAIQEKRPELANRRDIVFDHDNGRPHASLPTQKKKLRSQTGLFYRIHHTLQTLLLQSITFLGL